MEFLSRDQSSLLEKKLRREIAEYGKPKFVVYYNSGGREYAPAANAIARSAGNFSEAMLLHLWSISGDPATDQRWDRYNSWRSAHHEPRQLYEAPGHRFGPEEVERFSNAVEFAPGMPWLRQNPAGSSCFCLTTTGWKSIMASEADSWSGN